MKLMMIAGEPSGDIRGAELASELASCSGAEVFGLGGASMASAGVELLADMSGYSVMGFAEVVGSLHRILALERMLHSECLRRRPDAVILVDYPGFNLRFASWASARGFRVIYYVSPQFWAWGGWRTGRVERSVDLMITLFSFERDFYAGRGMRAFWSGHPLVDSIPRPLPGGGELALLPGSRRQEIDRLLPVMLEAAGALTRMGLVDGVTVAASPGAPPGLYSAAASLRGARVVQGTRAALEGARAALVCSGTATLETALAGIPFAVMYRTSPLTYALARLLVRGVERICLASIASGVAVAPELIQGGATAGRAVECLEPLLMDGLPRDEAIESLAAVRRALGEPGAASRAAGRIALELGGRVAAWQT
jgi:lipid-A-disaccharide synthase